MHLRDMVTLEDRLPEIHQSFVNGGFTARKSQRSYVTISVKAVRCISGQKINFLQALPTKLSQSKSKHKHIFFCKCYKIIFF